ncbi:hypothetical protein SAMN05421823_104269 [Catalinimonas alkaloidigena]|uniref:Uncharacterized protein n=1 Tax=Catalinimonas alkaloidigena TaxID=1075417 RepID=A0A1G9GZQ6_9BACT|nr:hypothetical protein [Catalinimonas alkaloidigena]SDL06095.1 hypothetical protein SAMN05421823_104269 [Catalinimonas alkaloidigena]
MHTRAHCPTCQTAYDLPPDACQHCGFPFAGTEKEKSVFIGQQILKKGTISDTREHIQRARTILWIIGAITMVLAFVQDAPDGISQTFHLVLGAVFVGFGFLTYKKPFLSILIPLLLLAGYYIALALVEPAVLMQGVTRRIVFLGGLVYALVSIVRAEKARKESQFLKGHQYN